MSGAGQGVPQGFKVRAGEREPPGLGGNRMGRSHRALGGRTGVPPTGLGGTTGVPNAAVPSLGGAGNPQGVGEPRCPPCPAGPVVPPVSPPRVPPTSPRVSPPCPPVVPALSRPFVAADCSGFAGLSTPRAPPPVLIQALRPLTHPTCGAGAELAEPRPGGGTGAPPDPSCCPPGDPLGWDSPVPVPVPAPPQPFIPAFHLQSSWQHPKGSGGVAMAPGDALNPSQGPRSPPGALSQPQPLSTPGVPCAKGVAVPGAEVPTAVPWPLGRTCAAAASGGGVLAEAVGTLIFVGVVLGASAGPGPLAPALAGGLAAGGLVCTLGGPQANPALTLALLCTRKLGALRGALAVLAQCAGASLAAAAACTALPDGTGLVPRVGTVGTALAWETFATFQLALAAFATAERAAPQAGLALGSAVVAGALAAGPFSGGSMNPARVLGPAVVTGVWDHHWVYWLGPVLGAVLAGLSYEFVLAPGASREKLGACLACRDVALVETPSPSPSSLSARGPPAPPAEQDQGTA
ncbi:nascent polypeptide-associated complex subunit alpha, muscle-specific form-like [Manacus candei]|uniref:nascent polypeptide-associated complex subunit alpha, muscle-specific form-like n=1 Tax=Manacus candei TaxID=415023 RepID=UPI0022272CF6|nr:nascent polypeptide-associated complex subunit alpha, muscle-specific form-like [Manacus candei]